MGKNRRAGPKIFVYIRVANLGDFSLKKASLRILVEKCTWLFYTNTWAFKVLKGFFKIWVGSTVFTVPVLFIAKYRKMHETANPILFFIFKIKNENF
jgi:hypothetical protein